MPEEFDNEQGTEHEGQETPPPDQVEDQPGEGEAQPENDALSGLSEEVVGRINRATETLQQAANRAVKDPSSQNIAAAEKAKGKLEKLIESEDIELDPATALKQIAQDSLDYQKQSGETQKQYEARLARQDAQIAALSEQLYRSQFESKYPELAGRYDDLAKEAAKDAKVVQARELAQKSGDPNAQAMFEIIWTEKWNQVVAKESEAAKAKTNGKGKGKDPKGTSPLASRSGQAQGQTAQKSAAEILYGPKDD